MVRGQWVYAGGRAGNKPRSEEKIAITTACESLIADVLLPKYLPEITPSEFNYPIAIYGKWHGNKYRFITRYRSDRPDSFTREFEAPFARLEYVSHDRFDLSCHRHTGEWYCLYQRITLNEALALIATHFYLAREVTVPSAGTVRATPCTAMLTLRNRGRGRRAKQRGTRNG